MSSCNLDTDEFLAVKFPHLKKSWLHRLNKKVAWMKMDEENKGNAELVFRFSGWRLTWLNWQGRDVSND